MPRQRIHHRDALAPYWGRLIPLVVTLNGGGDRNQLWRQVQPATQPPAWWDAPWPKGVKVRVHPRGYAERRRAEYRKVLQQFVDTWLAAGRNFALWCKQNETLDQTLLRTVSTLVYSLHPNTAGGALRLPILPVTPWVKRNQGLAHAAYEFADLMENPLRDRLGKCRRCGRYFLSTKGHRNKVYCTQRCGSSATAVESTRRRRRREHEEKLKRARAWLRDLVPGVTQWKEHMARRANVTTRWLARAVNRGELRLPAFLIRSSKAKTRR